MWSKILPYLLTGLMLLVITVAGVFMVITLADLKNEIQQNEDEIEQLKEPCSSEDVRYPEKSPGCVQSDDAPAEEGVAASSATPAASNLQFAPTATPRVVGSPASQPGSVSQPTSPPDDPEPRVGILETVEGVFEWIPLIR